MPARTRRSKQTLYDYAHHKRSRAERSTLIDGTPCPYCHRPMSRQQALDWDHTTQTVTHAHCNRSAGARYGNQLRNRRLPRW